MLIGVAEAGTAAIVGLKHQVAGGGQQLPGAKTGSAKVLDDGDVAALISLEMAESGTAEPPAPAAAAEPRSRRLKALKGGKPPAKPAVGKAPRGRQAKSAVEHALTVRAGKKAVRQGRRRSG